MTALEKPTSGDLRERIRRSADLMRRDERRFVDAMVSAVTLELPSLGRLPPASLERSIAGDFRRSLAAVSGERGGSDHDATEWTREAAALVEEGIPLEALLRSHRVATRRAWRLALDCSERYELDPQVVLAWAQLLWEWSDDLMVRIAEAYRSAEAGEIARDRRERDAFLRRVLRGTAGDADLRERAAAYGLSRGAPYRAFRARPCDEVGLPRLRRAIEAGAGAQGRQPLLTEVDGDLAGLAPAAPEIELDAIVALGHPTELPSAGASFLLASRVLETALALGLRGSVRAEDLSVRLAVSSEDVLGDLLVERYIEPLRPLRGFGGALEDTLREYLASGMRVEETARRLHVHPNSLRHRLRRFEGLTGADLHRMQDVVELWWALERRSLQGAA